MQKQLNLFGVASCWGAQDTRCSLAPDHLKSMNLERCLSNGQVDTRWQKIIRPTVNSDGTALNAVTQVCQELASDVGHSVRNQQPFVVFGGDHSTAIGTWSGVAKALGKTQSLGLIWIDAHMDSHLPETSPSGALHGMPLACLLGHGESVLTHMASQGAALLPKNVCLIGIRSFESGEAALLQLLGVRIFYMDEVRSKGLTAVMQQAINHVTKTTDKVGITIDLDAIDPNDAPGVGSPAADGIGGQALLQALTLMKHHPKLVGVEIAELNPELDQNNKTAELAIKLVESLFL